MGESSKAENGLEALYVALSKTPIYDEGYYSEFPCGPIAHETEVPCLERRKLTVSPVADDPCTFRLSGCDTLIVCLESEKLEGLKKPFATQSGWRVKDLTMSAGGGLAENVLGNPSLDLTLRLWERMPMFHKFGYKAVCGNSLYLRRHPLAHFAIEACDMTISFREWTKERPPVIYALVPNFLIRNNLTTCLLLA